MLIFAPFTVGLALHIRVQLLTARDVPAIIAPPSDSSLNTDREQFMRVAFAVAFLSLAACGQPPSTESATVAPTEQAPAKVRAASVEGWKTDLTDHGMIGSSIPAFTLKQADGTELTQENLRDRWTILGFATSETTSEDETRFIAALNSAVDQDPDLDFLQIHRPPPEATAPRVTPWPSVRDEGGTATAFGITETPAYLLIGPDLTIEGYRGALSASPDDGIKSVIRGVAEIRKQVASPQ
jgi:hypothetical protein